MISIIAAIDGKRGIGKGGKIPWHIPEDLKRFKALTTGHPIIMGRKTFESIGRVLPGRTNIIVTQNPEFIQSLASQGQALQGYTASSLEEAFRIARGKPGSEEIFIIGGGQIYEQAINLADKLYLTVVDGSYRADIFFPDYLDFKTVSEEKRQSGNYSYKFVNLVRKT